MTNWKLLEVPYRLILGTLQMDSFLKRSLAFLLFAICLGDDIFFDIFLIKNFIIFYIYFTLFCFLFFAILIKKNNLRLPYAVIPIAVFIGINFLSLLWSVRLKDAEIVIVLFSTGFLSFLIFPNIIQKEDDIYLFLKSIVIAASLNALSGIGQGIFGYNFIAGYGFAAHGTLYNPNPFSSFLGIVYPIAILLFAKERKNRWLLTVFLIFLANLFSISRVGIFTILLISALALLFLFRKGYRPCGIRILCVILVAALTYFFIISLRANLYPAISSEISLQRVPIPEAAINRTIIWQGTLRIISNHLFWGAGLRSFQDMFKHFNNPYVVWPRPHAHNLFLHITSEVGIVGLLFFILFIFTVLFTCVKNYRNSRNLQFKISSFFLLLALSGFLFNNLTEYNWEYPLFQVSFYFLASIIFVMKRLSNPEREEISFRGTRSRTIALSGFLIIFWIVLVGSPWTANYYLSKAKKLQPENGKEAIHDLLKASFLDSSNPEPHSSLSHIYRGAWFNTKNALFFERAVHFQQKVIRSFPMEADFYLDAAKLYEDGKRIKEAQRYYEKTIDINPNTPHYKQELALFLARNNKTERAIALWKDLRVFLEKYEPKGLFLMTVYMNLCASYHKMEDNELLGYYLNLVMNFPDDMIREEPADSPIRKTFISYKKRAKEELTNLVGRKKL